MYENETAFDNMIATGDSTIEEGTIRGRGYIKVAVTEALGAAPVNGPTSSKGQWLWNGTYTVALDRGNSVSGVYHLTGMGFAGQNQRVLPWGERVTVTWLTRNDVMVPVILDGCTIDFYTKQLFSRGHLLDFGEQIIRGAMAAAPGAFGDYPFSDNQYEGPSTVPQAGNEDTSKVIKFPGGETFYDKFGRVITLSRTPDYETLVTNGRVDSGQDDIGALGTVSEQNAYYNSIKNDESVPVNAEEPFAPKPINLVQYQQKIKEFKVEGDLDSNRTVRRGILPRFDKWKFVPIIIRKYKADSDGDIEPGDTFSTSQIRHRTMLTDEGNVYGHIRTITEQGDVKEFVPRHVNQRIVGDRLQSIGGNDELKVKTTDRLSDGSPNPQNWVHREYLVDGTCRLRVNEDVTQGKATFDQKISPDGTMELYIKEGGGNSSDNNISIKYLPNGTLDIKTKQKIVIDSEADLFVGGETGAEPIPLGDKLKAYIDSLLAEVFQAWVPVPSDGGAALKALFSTWNTAHATDDYLSDSRKVNN